MLALQLLINGLITGSALGIVAISFSLVFSTAKIFHVAHAGVYTMAGYLAWSLLRYGVPSPLALVLVVAICAGAGALIEWQLYDRLKQRRATDLVILIASIGLLAVMQNTLSAIYTPNILQFPLPWASQVVAAGGIRLSWAEILTVVFSLSAYGATIFFANHTNLGKRIRAVASNPFLAEITRLEPRSVYVYVIAIASALVALPGVMVPLDFGLQPYGGLPPLLTATIAMIAGGVGSLHGAYVVAVAIAVMQNLCLLFIPGEWSVGITFSIFVFFMLFRPTGLFSAAR